MAGKRDIIRAIFGEERNIMQEVVVIIGVLAMLFLFFFYSPWQGRLPSGEDVVFRKWDFRPFASGDKVGWSDGTRLIVTGRDWQPLLFEGAFIMLIVCVLCWLLKTGKGKLFNWLFGKLKRLILMDCL